MQKETGEPNRQKDRSYTKKHHVLSKTKNKQDAKNANKVDYVHKCACWLFVCVLNVHVCVKTLPAALEPAECEMSILPLGNITASQPCSVCDCVWMSAASAALYTEERERGQSIHTVHSPMSVVHHLTSPHLTSPHLTPSRCTLHYGLIIWAHSCFMHDTSAAHFRRLKKGGTSCFRGVYQK